MEMFATLLCMFSMLAILIFLILFIVNKIKKKSKSKFYLKCFGGSLIVFIVSIVLFAVFETPESKAKYEQQRIKKQQLAEEKKTEQKNNSSKKENITETNKKAQADSSKKKKTEKKSNTKKEETKKKSSTSSQKEPNTTENNSSEKHIYDTAQIKDVFNGTRDKKIGEYSIIECLSTDVDESVLADWYYNYVIKNNFNWCMILFTDTNSGNDTYLGAYAILDDVEYNVKYTKNEYGDYDYSLNIENSTLYLPDGNNGLTVFVGRDE
nr:hypothetical protein [uncultured Mediterraneibacter sp.]